jgi:hypothetical protein
MSKGFLVPVSFLLAALASSGCDGDLPAPVSCAPSSASFTAPAYVPAPQSTGVCSAADIGDFITACGVAARTDTLLGGTDTCSSWIADNLSSSCQACLVNAKNNGAVLVDVSGLFPVTNWLDSWIGTNSFACTQLLTGNTDCASTGISLDDCENAACDLACENANAEGAFSDCAVASASTGGACAASYATATSNCQQFFDDAGFPSLPAPCYPVGGLNASVDAGDVNLAFVANLICGAPELMDGGAPADAEADAGSPGDAQTDGGLPDDAQADTGAAADAASDTGSPSDAAPDAAPPLDAATSD